MSKVSNQLAPGICAVLMASAVPLLPAHAQRQVGIPIKPDAIAESVPKERAAFAASVTPVTDEMLLNPPDSEWLHWRRTYDEMGFSPLAQINKGNVASLRPAFAWSLPPGTSENTPLEHDGVLYVFGNGDHLQALNAVNGDLLWEYTRPQSAQITGPASIKRSFAIYGDKVYMATADNHLVTLDVRTGKVVWDKKLLDESQFKYQMSSGPLIVKGKVIQGVTGCGGLQPGGCFILGLDANDGRELWRFNTLAHPGEPGGESWNGLPVERRNGGSVWITGSYDPDLDMVYFGTGNTYNWQDLVKGVDNKPFAKPKRGNTADGLYISSTVALKPETGKLVWHYQHLPQDVWDLDFAFEQQIVTLPVKGKDEKLVVSTGKTVIIDAVDAATGKWVFSKDMGLQNIVKSIDPKTGRKTIDPMAEPDLTGQRNNLQCPAGYGAKNWPSDSYNAKTKILYIPISEVCGESSPKIFGADDKYSGGGQETRMARYQPGSDGNIGRLDAVNLDTKQVLWSTRQRASMTSAVVDTAGGVLFAGDADRWFRAYDDASGKVLWQMRLNDAINSYPITYSVKGRQYVAIVAGSGGPRIGNLHQLTPEIQTPRTGSAAVWVFELPQAAAP
jgi:alcohol dehydrogenase (cytochrome c)